MPELAEVEYMRKQVCSLKPLQLLSPLNYCQWNIGINLNVASISIHENNVFKVFSPLPHLLIGAFHHCCFSLATP